MDEASSNIRLDEISSSFPSDDDFADDRSSITIVISKEISGVDPSFIYSDDEDEFDDNFFNFL